MAFLEKDLSAATSLSASSNVCRPDSVGHLRNSRLTVANYFFSNQFSQSLITWIYRTILSKIYKTANTNRKQLYASASSENFSKFRKLSIILRKTVEIPWTLKTMQRLSKNYRKLKKNQTSRNCRKTTETAEEYHNKCILTKKN